MLSGKSIDYVPGKKISIDELEKDIKEVIDSQLTRNIGSPIPSSGNYRDRLKAAKKVAVQIPGVLKVSLRWKNEPTAEITSDGWMEIVGSRKHTHNMDPCNKVKDLRQGYLGKLYGLHIVCPEGIKSIRNFLDGDK